MKSRIFVLQVFLLQVTHSNSGMAPMDPGHPLFLTPYIQSGQIAKAKSLSYVTSLAPAASGLISYSGLLTVNSAYKSNLFFWFFPAATKPDSAPLILWLNGGPGSTSLVGLFVENGPFVVDKDLGLHLRDTSWTRSQSVLYIDSPVGAGFSFTGTEAGYARTEEDVARDLYSALSQFFTMFPEYRARDFYVTGESYGGKYVPAIAYKIHVANQDLPQNERIKLTGMAIGNGWTDPLSNLIWGDVLFNFGLIDEPQRYHFRTEEAKIKKYIQLKQFEKAVQAISLIFGNKIGGPPTDFQLFTGYEGFLNMRLSKDPPEWSYYVNFTQLPSTGRALHVGGLEFSSVNTVTARFLGRDFADTVKPWVETLLDAPEAYRVLYYSGNRDISIPTAATERLLNSLEWKGSAGYLKAERKIWRKMSGALKGYSKEYKNLSFVTVRNAGHLVPADQPERALEMITRFTMGSSMTGSSVGVASLSV